MFVILEGKAEIWRTRDDGSTYQAGTYEAGEVFGITSLVSGQKRLADVVAVDKVKLLAFRWESIHRLARLYPRIATRFHQNLVVIISKRLFNETMGGPYRNERSELQDTSYIQSMN
jgi:CRP-like cAMP-binding protein